MKKLILLFCFSLFTFQYSFSQGVWTWIKGDSSFDSIAVYGTQGVPSPANKPQGLYEAAEWTDQQGNFWFFGGATNGGEVGDLWKYDITTNNWTWVKGTGTLNYAGNYGKKGVAALTNEPPAHGYGLATWVDLNGDLWLYDFYALWRYNIASNIWTWVQGTTSYAYALYGTQGIPSANNSPGENFECSAAWVDSLGNLWMFGGTNILANSNTLWKYDIKSNEWTWMSGADTLNAIGTYGTLGVSNSTNVPGSRVAYSTWKDSNGKFWLFGGGYINYSGASTNFDCFNDMWKYDASTNEWTWMSGNNFKNGSGVYGQVCNPSINIFPSSRFETRARWIDNCGRFWMYGGSGHNSSNMLYNELWIFDPGTLKWTFASGSAGQIVNPVYGSIGIANLTNQPGSRYGAVSWIGNNGAFYIFGGASAKPPNVYDDLWKYQPDASCSGASYSQFNLGNDTAYCGSFGRVLSSGDTATKWSTGVTASQITVTVPGKYWASINTGCGIATDTINIKQGVYAGSVSVLKENVCSGSSTTLTVSEGAGNIQWQSSSDSVSFSNIPGATSAVYNSPNLTQTIYYRVKEIGSCGTDSSAVKKIQVFPAPFAGFVTATPDSACQVGVSTILKTDSSYGHLQWQSSTAGSKFANIAGDTLNGFNITPLYYATTYYRLIASATCGIDSSNIATFVVTGNPRSYIFVNGINGLQVKFSSVYDSTGLSYRWNFGDSTMSIYSNPIHTYKSANEYTVCLTVTNSINCSDSSCYNVNVSVATGSHTISSELVSIHLYPNPANNELTIEVLNSEAPKQITITNDLGQTLIQLNTYKTKTQIDVGALSAGIYFVKTQLADGSIQVRKFVKE